MLLRRPRLCSSALALACISASLGSWPSTALSETRALLMGIGDYQGKTQNLPGVSEDMRLARDIAKSLGIAEADMTTLKDTQLSLAGLRQAFENLIARTESDDRVFVYYTGHGSRATAAIPAPAHCAEALVSHDYHGLFDRELSALLDKLARKSEKLVFFLDACFSGGATTRALGTPPPDLIPKYAKLGGHDDCRRATNLGASYNGFVPATRGLGTNYVYIAAARPDEVSYQISQRQRGNAILA